MASNMVKERTHGQMDENTLDLGAMDSRMEMD